MKPKVTVIDALIDMLIERLSAPYLKTLTTQYDALYNAAASRGLFYFVVGEHTYFNDQNVVPNGKVNGRAASLPADLMPLFRAWYAPYHEMVVDMRRIKQTFTTLAARAQCWQDIRDMFPEYLIKPMQDVETLQGLHRTRPDLDAGENDPFSPPSEARLEREKHWDPRMLNLYRQVSPTVTLYLGYALL